MWSLAENWHGRQSLSKHVRCSHRHIHVTRDLSAAPRKSLHPGVCREQYSSICSAYRSRDLNTAMPLGICESWLLWCNGCSLYYDNNCTFSSAFRLVASQWGPPWRLASALSLAAYSSGSNNTHFADSQRAEFSMVILQVCAILLTDSEAAECGMVILQVCAIPLHLFRSGRM